MLLVLFFSCTSRNKAAVLTLESDTIQIGTVMLGDSVRMEVTLFNSGDDTLSLKHLAMSCGCTKGEFSSQTILPEQSGSIKLEYRNIGDIGAIDKSVVIENNSSIPFKVLRIQGTGTK